MGVYARGTKLWIRFRDAKGMWRDAATGYSVGQEELAQVMHDETVARIGATTKTVKHAPARGLTVRGFVAEWLPKRRERGLDWKADESRLNRHVLPYIGDLPSGGSSRTIRDPRLCSRTISQRWRMPRRPRSAPWAASTCVGASSCTWCAITVHPIGGSVPRARR
jgi:hypothetical protein